jgi:hypothetical protein
VFEFKIVFEFIWLFAFQNLKNPFLFSLFPFSLFRHVFALSPNHQKSAATPSTPSPRSLATAQPNPQPLKLAQPQPA